MRCRALGEGYFAVADSNACIKISGYIAAGVDFAAPVRAGPVARSAVVGPPVGIDSSAAVSLDAQFDTPLGPGRLYVQVGRDHIAP